MFDFDKYQEILNAIRNNKLRTLLTGFAVAWGILFIILLLGAGNGFMNGIASNFKGRAVNTMNIYSSITDLPFAGYQVGRKIELKEENLAKLKKTNKEIGYTSLSLDYYLDISKDNLSRNNHIAAVEPYYQMIQEGPILYELEGRFINESDIRETRKVIVIDSKTSEFLFPTTSSIGKYVTLNDLQFLVVGCYKTPPTDFSSSCYIPYATAKRVMPKGHYTFFVMQLNNINSNEANEEFNSRIKSQLAELHNFDKKDKRGVYIYNSKEEYIKMQAVMSTLRLFLWILGISVLLVGIVGVSNIMLITVRERSKEIGIRKALGAKPRSIIMLIIMESVFITVTFGYIGLVIGMALTEAAGWLIENYGLGKASIASTTTTMFLNPTIDLSTAITALIVMIISGILAGYFPARKATKISAIDSMRANE